jgi:hypothetical protein
MTDCWFFTRHKHTLWPLFGLCPQPMSSECPAGSLGRSGPYLGCVLGLCPQLVSCGPFWVALALIWAVSSACVQLVSCGHFWVALAIVRAVCSSCVLSLPGGGDNLFFDFSPGPGVQGVNSVQGLRRGPSVQGVSADLTVTSDLTALGD